MASTLGLGSVKRYGVRYGRTLKMRAAVIEREQKKPQVCPFCKKAKAHRTSVGIYECRSCDAKFTGPAYALTHVQVRVEAPVAAKEELAEE